MSVERQHHLPQNDKVGVDVGVNKMSDVNVGECYWFQTNGERVSKSLNRIVPEP